MQSQNLSWWRRHAGAFVAWLDSEAPLPPTSGPLARLLRVLPFVALHLGCVAVLWVGFSWPALWCAVFLYCFRVFSLTAFYHRYFSHRSFGASRGWQFVFALCGATAAQRGPLWWAAHHRHHHLHTDEAEDSHSPRHGFWHSHMGWFSELRHYRTDYSRIPDFAKYRELVFLNRFDSLVPIAMLFGLYFLGEALAGPYPQTSGWQFVVWGGCISTVAVYHATFCVNSVCHIFGGRRFVDKDEDSRNNWLVALLTFGEGWHNNHHRYPAAARQGFMWWEVDITYYILKLLERMRVIRNLKTVPASVMAEAAGAPPAS